MERIEITGIGSELQGVGRLSDGRAVFVPGAIPGETVDIEINRDKGRFCEASLVEVAEPSPDRIAPECPVAGLCGGCQGRHMRYERTLALKRRMVSDALSRIGGLARPTVLETLGCADPDRTRNKAEYPIALQEGRFVIGAYERGGRRIVPLEDCLLQAPESVAALREVAARLNGWPIARHLKYLVTRVNHRGEVMAVLCGDAPIAPEMRRLSPAMPGVRSLWYCHLNRRFTHALDGSCTRISGAPTLTQRLFDLDFEISPQSFFQVNRRQTEALYQKALEAAGVVPGCALKLLDAYCGAGTITLSAARYVASAVGIEIVPPAIENARRNAGINHIENVRFVCGDAAREIPALLARGERFDVAILDPPRKGADAALLQALARADIPAISYVSCNPATLARDVKVETVCLLSKIRSAPHIDIDLDMTELDVTKAETKATYEEIKAYVLEHTGLKVSCLYIAQVKAKHGIIERDCYNKPKTEGNRVPQCPPEKEKAIEDALRHFQMITD